jgi:histidinol-phosphatase (PHP family)
MLADYHVHSAYSDDSDYDMEEVVKDAIRLNLSEICFTDHVDYGIKNDWNDIHGIKYREGGPGEPERIPLTNVNYPLYMKQIHELQKTYKDRITIRTGLEFGMQRGTIPAYEQLYAHYPFDFILLSVHEIDNKELWTQEFQAGKSQSAYNRAYYDEMLYLVTHYKNYSVLAHMDLITRYDLYGHYDIHHNEQLIRDILGTVIHDGKGIEYNTSSFRYGLSDSTPSMDILKLYRDLGGSVITIGSDSHKKEHLGSHLSEAMEHLKEIGFTAFCTYEEMKPIFHKL